MCVKVLFQNVRRLCILLMICFLSSCFSPWKGSEGTLTLHLGGGPGRAAVEENEQNSLNYTITLTGPGPSLTQTFSGMGSATFRLQPGTWNVTVKGRGAVPNEYNDAYFDPTMLRAFGEKTVTIRGGDSASEAITMFPATEAANGQQLSTAFIQANNVGKKEYVFITGDDIKIATSDPDAIPPLYVESGQNIELRAEKKVTIERFNINQGNTPLLIISGGGRLTLGKQGETHQYLHITGDINGEDQGSYATVPLVKIDGSNSDAALIMYDARINHNRAMNVSTNIAPGVLVTGSKAKFTMYGGLIDGNSGNQNGGGVSVENGGTFTLYGGDFQSNNANYGGQVYVGSNSFFYMYGGTLSNMGGSSDGTQAQRGAGVYIAQGGTFEKTGGTIYGSSPAAGGNNLRASDGGVAGNEYKLGDAVYYGSSSIHYVRNSTLDSTVNGNLSTGDLTTNWEHTNDL